MVSSLDLLDFSERIWGVMYGLLGRKGQEIVLIGACLSRIEESVELKS
jgi:hypothetical protein